ncbi:MAG: hypothetical protein J3K34DRAFT_442711 [Monoraphidium minutum]|nr:MAG: hypothetical protein J3K34DRAFT_442711 [Monoraphidium minutum]
MIRAAARSACRGARGLLEPPYILQLRKGNSTHSYSVSVAGPSAWAACGNASPFPTLPHCPPASGSALCTARHRIPVIPRPVLPAHMLCSPRRVTPCLPAAALGERSPARPRALRADRGFISLPAPRHDWVPRVQRACPEAARTLGLTQTVATPRHPVIPGPLQRRRPAPCAPPPSPSPLCRRRIRHSPMAPEAPGGLAAPHYCRPPLGGRP